MNISKLALVALLTLTCATFAFAQGTYTKFDYPGATGTFAGTVNTAGDIAGSWTDVDYNYHGFLLSNGTYTSINYPGADNTTVGGINDKGQIVGYTFTASQPRTYTGFLYDAQNQTFKTLADPAASTTLPSSINNAGRISGLASTATNTYIFSMVDSTYQLISPPTALQGGTFWVAGVTDSGAIVVTGETSSGKYVAYSYSNGSYSLIPLPRRSQRILAGVNPQGDAYVGSYDVSTFVVAGYLYYGDLFLSLQYPGSEDTNGEGINRSGEVVGDYTVDGTVYGFTWTSSAPDKKR
jgi:hypothetical protein